VSPPGQVFRHQHRPARLPMIMATMLLVANPVELHVPAQRHPVYGRRSARAPPLSLASRTSPGGPRRADVQAAAQAGQPVGGDAWFARFFTATSSPRLAQRVVAVLAIMAVFATRSRPGCARFSVLIRSQSFPSPRARCWHRRSRARPFLSRIIYGARHLSLTVGLSVQAIALLIGLTLGTLGRLVRRLD